MRISDWSSDVCSSDLGTAWSGSQGLAAVLRQEAPHRTGDAGRSHRRLMRLDCIGGGWPTSARSEEHTSELQSLMRISYAVFCLKKKKQRPLHNQLPDEQIKYNPTRNQTQIRMK